jgi:hypothetical protein
VFWGKTNRHARDPPSDCVLAGRRPFRTEPGSCHPREGGTAATPRNAEGHRPNSSGQLGLLAETTV